MQGLDRCWNFNERLYKGIYNAYQNFLKMFLKQIYKIFVDFIKQERPSPPIDDPNGILPVGIDIFLQEIFDVNDLGMTLLFCW